MATLQYDFKVVGLNSVMAAFRSLEQRALQHNRMLARMYGNTGGRAGGAGGVGGGGGAGGGARGGQADAHVRERQRMLRQQAIDDRRSFQESARSHRQFLAFRDRMYREERQQQDRHAKDQIRVTRRMERERLAERKQAERQAYRTAYRKASSRYDAGVGALTSLGSRAAGMLAMGGGAAIAAGISSELKLGKESTLLAVMSKQAGEKGSIKDIQKGLVDRIREVGKESGLDRADLVSGMTKFFSKSGNVNIAKEMLPFFAEMSDITGSSLEDIGDTAGMAFMQAMAKGMSPQEAKKVTEDILAAFAGQAAVGTIEMKDFAAYGPSLLSTAARFKGDYGRMAAVTGAMAQTGAYGGANRAAEAATALARFADQLRDAAPEFEKLGVQTYERDERGIAVQRDPIQIIKEVLAKTEGGDERILAKYFSNVRSMRAVAGFNVMYRAAGGGEAGLKAVDEHLNKFLGAQLSKAQIKEGAAAIRETPARQFEAAFNDLKDEIGKNLLPALTQLAPAMSKLVVTLKPAIEWLGRFVQSAVENPWGTVIEAVSLALVGSVAKAAIGEAIKAQIIKMMLVSGGVPGTGTPGVPGVPPVIPGGGGGSLLPGFLGRAMGLFALSTLAGDQASRTSEEEYDAQNLAEDAALEQFKKSGTVRMTYKRKLLDLPFFAPTETVTKDLTESELIGLSSQGIIKPQDFIDQFGKEGAQRLGLLTQGGEMAAPGGLSKAVADKQQQAADTFKAAVAAFAEAAKEIGGASIGNPASALFGLLNRGTGPSTPNPASGAR